MTDYNNKYCKYRDKYLHLKYGGALPKIEEMKVFKFSPVEPIPIEELKYYDDQSYPTLEKISQRLKESRAKIDEFDDRKYDYINRKTRLYTGLRHQLGKEYGIKPKPTNAWLKMFEMLYHFDLYKKGQEKTTSFHFAEAPGHFILANNYFLKNINKTKYIDWYANSLNPEHSEEALGDFYDLIKNNPNRWFFGQDDTGDIMKVENIRDFKEKLEGKTIDLVTSDAGTGMKPEEYKVQHILHGKLGFAQILTTLYTLSNGKNFILKTFLPIVKPHQVTSMYIMASLFDEFYVAKPLTSRPANGEVYFVGKGYRKPSVKYLEKLLSMMEGYSIEKGMFDQKLLSKIKIDGGSKNLQDPKEFIQETAQMNEMFIDGIIEEIDRVVNYMKNFEEFKKDELLLKEHLDKRYKKWLNTYPLK